MSSNSGYAGAGGALLVSDLIGGRFDRNAAVAGNTADDGGAIASSDASGPTGDVELDGCTLTGNTATRGGAVFSSFETALVDSVVSDDTAEWGGGIYVGGPAGRVSIQGGSVVRDTAWSDGGGVLVAPGRELVVVDADFGSDADDNAPSDVVCGTSTCSGGDGASFARSDDACVP